MGIHARKIRLSPLIHKGEERYKPYIVGDPWMVSLLWPPLGKILAMPLFSSFLHTHKLQLDTNCLILKTTCEYTPNGDDVLGSSSPWKYSGWELGRMTSIPGKVVGCWLNNLSNEKNKNHNLRNKPSSSHVFTSSIMHWLKFVAILLTEAQQMPLDYSSYDKRRRPLASTVLCLTSPKLHLPSLVKRICSSEKIRVLGLFPLSYIKPSKLSHDSKQ